MTIENVYILVDESDAESYEDIDIENDAEYEVERVVDKRVVKGKVEYRLKWVGYDKSHNSWEPLDFMNCEELINEFESIRSDVHHLSYVEVFGDDKYELFENFCDDSGIASDFESDDEEDVSLDFIDHSGNESEEELLIIEEQGEEESGEESEKESVIAEEVEEEGKESDDESEKELVIAEEVEEGKESDDESEKELVIAKEVEEEVGEEEESEEEKELVIVEEVIIEEGKEVSEEERELVIVEQVEEEPEKEIIIVEDEGVDEGVDERVDEWVGEEEEDLVIIE